MSENLQIDAIMKKPEHERTAEESAAVAAYRANHQREQMGEERQRFLERNRKATGKDAP
jgi:hypothetical protein